MMRRRNEDKAQEENTRNDLADARYRHSTTQQAVLSAKVKRRDGLTEDLDGARYGVFVYAKRRQGGPYMACC